MPQVQLKEEVFVDTVHAIKAVTDGGLLQQIMGQAAKRLTAVGDNNAVVNSTIERFKEFEGLHNSDFVPVLDGTLEVMGDLGDLSAALKSYNSSVEVGSSVEIGAPKKGDASRIV